jgi:RimJ/RimL family protein N-acetyltransferase
MLALLQLLKRWGGIHVGNIKLGNINWTHSYGDIGLIIGQKDYFGLGIATESISLVTEFAFRHLGLHKVWCGIYKPNIGSIKAFQKAGFEIYAEEPCKCLFEGKYVNCIYLHKINDCGN